MSRFVLMVYLVVISFLLTAIPAQAWNPELNVSEGQAVVGFNSISTSAQFPTDPEMFAVGNNNIYFSPDAGKDWCQALYDYEGDTSDNTPFVIPFATNVYMSPDFSKNHLLVISGPGKLYRATVTFYRDDQKISESKMTTGDYPVLSASDITSSTPMGLGASGGYNAFASGPNNAMYISNGPEIYKSTNGWSWSRLCTANATVYGLAVSPNYTKDGTLLYAAGSGVFISKNDGHTFEQLTLPNISSACDIGFSPNYATDGTIGVTVPGSGVYLSTDEGQSWQNVFSHQVLSLAFGGSGLYVGLASTSDVTGVYASFDGGKTWTDEGMGNEAGIVQLLAYPAKSGDLVYALPLDGAPASMVISGQGTSPPDDTATVKPQTTAVSASAWNDLDTLNVSEGQPLQGGFSYIAAAPQFPTDTEMFAVSNNIVYFSSDAGQDWWQTLFDYQGDTTGHPLVIPSATKVYVAPDFQTSHLVVISGPGKLYKATVTFYNGSQQISESDITADDYPVLRASDISPPSGTTGGNYPFVFGPNDSMFVSNGSGIYESTNLGGTWTLLYSSNDSINGLAVSPNYNRDGSILYSAGAGVFISKNSGQTFEKLSVPGVALPSDIDFSPNYATDDTIGVVVPESGLYLSTDEGQSWHNAFPSPSISFAFGGSGLYVGINSTSGVKTGVYASFNGGRSWTAEHLANGIVQLQAYPVESGDLVYALPQNGAPASAVINKPGSSPQKAATVIFQIGSNKYSVAGKVFQMDAIPTLDKSGRTFVPVRYLAESLGVAPKDISWDSSSRTVSIAVYRVNAVTTIRLTIGSNILTADGPQVSDSQRAVTMDVAPSIVKGRVILPARWVAQALGYKVQWNKAKQQIIMTVAPPQVSTVKSPPSKTPAAKKGTDKAQPKSTVKKGTTTTQTKTVVFQIGSTKYSVAGKAFQMDAAPTLDKTGRTFVPVRFLAEALGVPSKDIGWNAAAHTVSIAVYKGKTADIIRLTIGSNVLTVSGPDVPANQRVVTMDVAPSIVDGRVMLPARWVAQAMGYKVQWTKAKQQLIINM